MTNSKASVTFTGAGILSAVAASLCCITPIVALLAGSSSIAANFEWIEPARPYLIMLSVAVLALAWYIKYKPTKMNDTNCNCQTTQNSSFVQSSTFLVIVTLFAILSMSFPLYANVFYPKQESRSDISASDDNKKQAKFTIQGMTCEGCEGHVNNELSKVKGVIASKTSYANGSTLVTFDTTKVTIKTIETAISKIGYTVKNYQLINDRK